MSLRDPEAFTPKLPDLVEHRSEDWDPRVELVPLGPRILIERNTSKDTRYTLGGEQSLIIKAPTAVDEEKSQQGTVLRVGDKVTIDVKPGDVVIYARYSGQDFGDTKCFVLGEDGIIAKLVRTK